MRKFRFLTLALLGATSMFVTSCKPDEPADNEVGPTLTVTESKHGAINGTVEVTVGDSVSFHWDARKGTSDLDKFEVAINSQNISATSDNGNDLPYDIKNADDETYIDSYSIQLNNEGTFNYSFEVTDKNGLNKVVTLEVVVSAQTTPLASASSFTWMRTGSNPGTGLAQFGLKWTSNTSTSAIITEDQATRMVQLQASEWASITTQQGLSDAVENGTAINQYAGVSATAPNKTYDDVLGVRYQSEYYLILIQQSTVSTGGPGTTITITGLYKK